MTETGMRILISTDEVRHRVTGLGLEIAAAYPDGTLYLIGVLKGACVFLADLVRAIPRPVRFDFLGTSSYGAETISAGEVKLTKDVTEDIRGAHVLVVEDVVDTGITLDFLLEHLRKREPASLRTVTLLNKQARRLRENLIDFVGFEIPNEFVVGYGMDYNEDYRDLPDIRILDGTGV